MREFILRAGKAKTGNFDLDDLPNSGRMDIVARCISNAVYISDNMRRDTIMHVVLEGPPNPPKTISFHGDALQGFPYDERGIAQTIRKALTKPCSNEPLQILPGIFVSKQSFEALAKQAKNLYYLHPKGQDIREMKFEENVTFVFGDFIGMPKKTERFLENHNAKKIRLGPVTLFASHCIVVVHNELDRKQFT